MAMKFRAHETFFIRKGWLSKGMESVNAKPDLFVDKNENAMEILGIGSNMVKALRYWLQAVGLTQENVKGKRIQTLTEFGKIVYEKDRFIEEMGTLYLLQYMLASKEEEAPAWYYFFNEFNMSEFTKDDFVQGVQSFIRMKEGAAEVAVRSLNDDFNCIINTYLPRYKTSSENISPENNIDCPLGELGLIDIVNKKQKVYRKSCPVAKTFNPWFIYAVISDRAGDRKEISLNELLTKPGNIGRIYNLDAAAMLDVLHKAENAGLITIVRTAGLDVIQLREAMTFEQCVRKYYETIEKM